MMRAAAPVLLLALAACAAAQDAGAGYVTTAPGNCTTKAKAGDTVAMNYIGRLADGKIFDSNKERGPFSTAIGAGTVIKCWDMYVVGMCVGEKRNLTCPPDLAYGAAGQPPVIPANATLYFQTELLGDAAPAPQPTDLAGFASFLAKGFQSLLAQPAAALQQAASAQAAPAQQG